MIHQRERLPLGFEPGNDFARVHAHFDDFKRDAAFDGLPLLGHINITEAALADFLQELVIADDGAWALGQRRRQNGLAPPFAQPKRIAGEELVGTLTGAEQPFNPFSQSSVAGARRIQIGRAGLQVGYLPRRVEDRLLAWVRIIHVSSDYGSISNHE